MKILIADDNRSSRVLLEEFAVEWGYEPVLASDGLQAYNILNRENGPRLAILDWMMPGMDGPDICQKIKALGGPFCYFILLTSRGEKKDMLAGLGAGADDFLRKPVDPDELKIRLAVGVRTLQYELDLLAKERIVRFECYRAIVDLAEARDNETGQHLKRIAAFCRTLATQMQLPESYVADIEVFSQFHDIGKVGIPDSILLAPRKLSVEEFETMKTHAYLGYQILKDRHTLEMAAEIAFSHHEKFNGTGYPRGLAGEAIPLSGRISALADVYDALRTRRPYKQPWTHERAAELIRSERGQHFDPNVVDAFIKSEKEMQEISIANDEPPDSIPELVR